jgi:hypothetical protein
VAKSYFIAFLTDTQSGAHIGVMIDPVRFDLEYIRKGAPTGQVDWYWLRFTEYSQNKFYFYSGGNQTTEHPDTYFYDLGGKILIFYFDGPYARNSVVPEPTEAHAIEQTVLGSMKAPVGQANRIPSDAILYTNERYGFQLTLNAAWRGYRVDEQPAAIGGVTYLVFSAPAHDNINPYLRLLILGIQKEDVWNQRLRKCRCGAESASSKFHNAPWATAIARNRSTVFSLEYMAHDTSGEEVDPIGRKYQLRDAIESFRVLPRHKP